jgi:hypothetical protein
VIDPRLRWVVQCPGCERNWIVSSPFFASMTTWEELVAAGDIEVVREFNDPRVPPLDWAEVERLREAGMVR